MAAQRECLEEEKGRNGEPREIQQPRGRARGSRKSVFRASQQISRYLVPPLPGGPESRQSCRFLMAASTSCLGLPSCPGETDLCWGAQDLESNPSPPPTSRKVPCSTQESRHCPHFTGGETEARRGAVMLARHNPHPLLLHPHPCPQFLSKMERTHPRGHSGVSPGPTAGWVSRGHRAPLSNRESWGGSSRRWELVMGSGLPMETS